MVKETRGHFVCEECQFAYKEKSWAVKCEEYCKKHKSCSLDITGHAVKE